MERRGGEEEERRQEAVERLWMVQEEQSMREWQEARRRVFSVARRRTRERREQELRDLWREVDEADEQRRLRVERREVWRRRYMVEREINGWYRDAVVGVDRCDVAELAARRLRVDQRVEWGWEVGYWNFILDIWRQGIAT